jgi:tetratricopeptide (TPR) repeat protein
MFHDIVGLSSARVAWRALCLATLLALAAVPVTFVRADDPLLDAHRREIAEMMRQDDFTHAAALCEEILAKDPTHAEDHLLLARAYDKMRQPALALAEYQAVRDLLPPVPQNDEQRTDFYEADRRIKALDPSADKLRAIFSELDKKLEVQERDCRESNDKAGFKRIQQIRDQVAALLPGRTHVVLDLSAKVDFFDSGLSVVAGQTYHVVATGTWASTPGMPTDADGMPNTPLTEGNRQGALLGEIGGNSPFLLGKDVTFVASSSGRFRLAINDNAKSDNTGSLHIYVGIDPPPGTPK